MSQSSFIMEIETNSRLLLHLTKSLVIRLINLTTSFLVLTDLGAPFASLVFSVVKMKLLELLLELNSLEATIGVRGGPGQGPGGSGGPGGSDGRGGQGNARPDGGDGNDEGDGPGPVAVPRHAMTPPRDDEDGPRSDSGVPGSDPGVNGLNGMDREPIEVKILKEVTNTSMKLKAMEQASTDTWSLLKQREVEIKKLEDSMRKLTP